MLEEVLKNINTNLERIADALELKNGEVNKKEKKKIVAEDEIMQECLKQRAVEIPAVETAEEMHIQAIPVVQKTESFTRDEIARAMGQALDCGRGDVVTKILQTFNVQALTQISENNFGTVATILREAGIEV